MLVNEFFNEIPKDKGYFGYIVKITKHNRNYIKYGTTTNPTQRFKGKDYKECQSIKPIYFAKFDNEYEMANFEELNKSYMREQLLNKKIKGLKWVAKDRFTYNKKPKQMPIIYTMDSKRFIEI